MTWDADQIALERSFTLSADDIQIVLLARGLAQRLERALMLTWMRAERELVSDVKTLPAPVIAYVALQLELEPAILTDYVSYQQTRTAAAQEIREYLGVKPYTEALGKRLQETLVGKIAHTGHTAALLQAAQDWLVEEGILRPPGDKTLETLVYAARTRGEEQLFAQIAAQLQPDQRAVLDALCQTEEGISQLALFRRPPRKPSSSSIVAECARLRAMRQVLVEDLDWGTITMNRLRQWAAIVRRLSAQALRRYPDAKRATLLLAFLVVRAEEVTNIIVEMFDQLVGRIFTRSDAEVEQTKVDRARFLQTSARHLRQVAEIITNEAIKDEAVRQELLRYLSPEGWAEHKTLYDAFERGEVAVLFSLLTRRFKHLREFAPTVLDTLALSSPRAQHPLLEGLQILATVRDKRGRAAQLPEGTTTAFVPAKWEAAVTGKEGLNRKAWELTLMHEVRGALRSGDVIVGGSRRYAAWDTDLYSHEAWQKRRAAWYREQGLPEDGATYVAQLKAELHEVTRAVARALPTKAGIARIVGDRLIVTPLDALPVSAEVVQARALLARWLPHPGLPDLLQEVDHWTGFSEAFFHLGSHRAPSAQQVREMLPGLYAALIAEGTNLGIAALAQASGMRAGLIQRALDWYLREETVREAIIRLIQYHRSLPLTAHFGDGTTSSSDGIRFGVAPSALGGRHQPRHFGLRRGVTMLNHVSDQGTQFWVDMVNCQMHESTYVLDGLVYQDTYPIKEHYTDTGSFTELVFGCFELLGFRFAPKLKDLPDQVLYRMERSADYGPLNALLHQSIREQRIIDQWDEMNRLAASFKDDVATPSLVIAKLQASQRTNPLQLALQELGRVGKIRHILVYAVDEEMQRRVRVGLNKGERVNGLARVTFFGQQGRFQQREYEAQLNRATALSLLINAISVWNTRYYQEIAEQVGGIAEEVWAHISPISWEHIQFVGSYSFDELVLEGELRPLLGESRQEEE
jgi:TnpA family transposase